MMEVCERRSNLAHLCSRGTISIIQQFMCNKTEFAGKLTASGTITNPEISPTSQSSSDFSTAHPGYSVIILPSFSSARSPIQTNNPHSIPFKAFPFIHTLNPTREFALRLPRSPISVHRFVPPIYLKHIHSPETHLYKPLILAPSPLQIQSHSHLLTEKQIQTSKQLNMSTQLNTNPALKSVLNSLSSHHSKHNPTTAQAARPSPCPTCGAGGFYGECAYCRHGSSIGMYRNSMQDWLCED